MQKQAISKNANLLWFRKFVALCERHNIWYTVTNGTLLGTIRHKGPIPWDDDFDVMLTPESYAKLKQLYPNSCLDGISESGYPLIIPKFVPNHKEYQTTKTFVDVFLVVPTTSKQVKKFRSLWFKTSFSTQVLHSPWRPYAWHVWLAKWLLWLLHFFVKKQTHKHAVMLLTSKTPDFFYTIDNPVDPKAINVIPQLSKVTERKRFADFFVRIPKEYKMILVAKYGKNYMRPDPSHRSFDHVNALSIRRRPRAKNQPNPVVK